jgi:hypothetical protein
MAPRNLNPALWGRGGRSSKNVQLGGEHHQDKPLAAAKQESSEVPHLAGIRGFDRWDIVQEKNLTAKVASFLPANAEKWP